MTLPTFNDPCLAPKLISSIRKVASKCNDVTIMEVCGTHTMEIGRLGIRSLLPENVRLVSGPGCPMCVTPGWVIDAACKSALTDGTVILSFGDMLRVPGNRISFQKAKAAGADVRVITSPLQCLDIASAEPSKTFIAVAVGFETTIPSVARAVQIAYEKNIVNLRFFIAHRLVIPALEFLVKNLESKISAFLLPGHVSAVIGQHAYNRLDSVTGVISGFEPLDILGAILVALRLIASSTTCIINLYPRVVRTEGNVRALKMIEEVFEPVDAQWRSIGVIKQSGLALRKKYASLDAASICETSITEEDIPNGCCCGDVLKGIITPNQCSLFGKVCTPVEPKGPCMVSSEGSCAAYYRYGGFAGGF